MPSQLFRFTNQSGVTCFILVFAHLFPEFHPSSWLISSDPSVTPARRQRLKNRESPWSAAFTLMKCVWMELHIKPHRFCTAVLLIATRASLFVVLTPLQLKSHLEGNRLEDWNVTNVVQVCRCSWALEIYFHTGTTSIISLRTGTIRISYPLKESASFNSTV